MVRSFHPESWLRVLAMALLIPLLMLEPFFTKMVIFLIPLFVLLAFTADMMNVRSQSKKINAYLLITSLYLIGVMSEGSFIRTMVVTGLVMSIYALSVETT
ncbi:hypothetical protein [Jeotgalibacillus marinus]|uniref:Uncharacterized protein n=1 Tax=Jeotgalibacillus marinus TaxID=86667 RepID=A0ABV3Q2Y5_9BACL